MRPFLLVAGLAALTLTAPFAPAVAGAYTFTNFDVPGAGVGSTTLPFGINNAGQVVGYYYGNYPPEGFLYDSSTSKYFTFNPPGASGGTYAQGINDSGQVVGTAVGNGMQSFVGNPITAHYTALSISGAVGINNAGQIALNAFLRDPVTGSYTGLSYPGATYTVAQGINNAGQVVGYYLVGGGGHGFIYDSASSIYTTVNLPGDAVSGLPFGINDAGQVVGTYYDPGVGEVHTFLFNLASGSLVTLDDPAATIGTFARGLNNAGQIVGFYQDSVGQHGFIATPVPEPASLVLLGTGLAGLGFQLFRRGRSAV